MRNVQQPAPEGRFPGFDALRALAAIAVLLYHAGKFSGVNFQGPAGQITGRLDVGVAVFFVISGFLLFRPFAVATQRNRPAPSTRAFLVRRAARILPAYWLALTLLAIFVGLESVFTKDWWRFYLLLQVYSPDLQFQGLAPAWTLCVEASFYLLIPIYALGTRRVAARFGSARAQWIVLGLLTSMCLGFREVMLRSDDLRYLTFTLPGLWHWFAFGIALALLSISPPSVSRTARFGDYCWLAAAGVLASLLVLSGRGLPDLVATTMMGLTGFLIIAPGVWPSDRGFSRRFLGSTVALFLGEISYGIYLWHEPLIHEISKLMGSGWPSFVLTAAIGLVVSGTIAAASYILLERPVQRIARDRGNRPTEPDRAGIA